MLETGLMKCKRCRKNDAVPRYDTARLLGKVRSCIEGPVSPDVGGALVYLSEAQAAQVGWCVECMQDDLITKR